MKCARYILSGILLGLSACSNEEMPTTSAVVAAKPAETLTVFNEQIKTLEKAKELEQVLLEKDKKLQHMLE